MSKSEVNVSIAFDPSPSELRDQGAAPRRVVPHYKISYMKGFTKDDATQHTLEVPIGNYRFTINGLVGQQVEAFIYYINGDMIPSHAVRYAFKIQDVLPPEPPSRVRIAAVVPVLPIADEVAAVTGQAAPKPVKIPDGQWVVVSKDGTPATAMSIDEDGRGIHCMAEGRQSHVIYPESEVAHVITPSGHKISLQEFLEEIGISTGPSA